MPNVDPQAPLGACPAVGDTVRNASAASHCSVLFASRHTLWSRTNRSHASKCTSRIITAPNQIHRPSMPIAVVPPAFPPVLWGAGRNGTETSAHHRVT